MKIKTIKAVTDFGIIDVKPKGKKVEIMGEFWIIADIPTKYMNSPEPLILTDVLHYSTGYHLPLHSINHRSTNKERMQAAEKFLSNIPLDKIKAELSKLKIINQ